MGEFRDAAAFGNRIRQYAAATETVSTKKIKAGSKVTKAVIVKAMQGAVGADLRMSNWKRGGGKINVGYTLDLKSNNLSSLFRPRGPIGAVETGTRPHEITATLGKITGKGAKRAKQQRVFDIVFGATGTFAGAKPLRTPYGPRYRVIHHPGTRGKHPWATGRALSIIPARREMQTTLREIIKEATS